MRHHPFADGCKRIAASLFLEFPNRNNALFRDGLYTLTLRGRRKWNFGMHMTEILRR